MKKKVFLGLTGSAVAGGAAFHFLADDQLKSDVYGIAKSGSNAFYASAILTRCVYDYIYKLKGFEYNSDEYVAERAKIHRACAERVLYLSEKNRGIYLKAGQYIGNLERIMPREWTDVLKVLQDSGPFVPFEEIKVVVEHDRKVPLEQTFQSFDKVPLAAASLAQVHKAKLHDGTEVAVKLQFPFLRTQFRADAFVIKYIARFVNQLLKWNDYENIDLVKNYDTFREALEQELNFKDEIANAEITRSLFKSNPQIYIPKNYQDLSTSRMIVQEFVAGPKINDTEGIKKIGLDPKEVAELLVDTFAEMIFKHGHIHCDAHPGNIFIRPMANNPKKPQLVLLDHGFYRDLPNSFRINYSKLWTSLIGFEYDKVKALSYELGIGEFYKYLPLVLLFRTMGSTKKIGEPINDAERKYLREKDVVNFEKVNQLMNALPPDMLFIIRASNLVAVHNGVLGGSTRYRFMKFTDLAFKNVEPNPFLRLWLKLKFYIRIFLLEKFPAIYSTVYHVEIDQ